MVRRVLLVLENDYVNLIFFSACAIIIVCECGEVRYCYWYLFSS